MLIASILAARAAPLPALDRQLDAAWAQSNCDCGCPSVSLGVDKARVSAADVDDTELMAHEPEGTLFASLSVRNGYLVELDCVAQSELASFPRELSDISGWSFSERPLPLA